MLDSEGMPRRKSYVQFEILSILTYITMTTPAPFIAKTLCIFDRMPRIFPTPLTHLGRPSHSDPNATKSDLVRGEL